MFKFAKKYKRRKHLNISSSFKRTKKKTKCIPARVIPALAEDVAWVRHNDILMQKGAHE